MKSWWRRREVEDPESETMPGTELEPAGAPLRLVTSDGEQVAPERSTSLVPRRLREIAERQSGPLLPSRAQLRRELGWYWRHRNLLLLRGGRAFVLEIVPISRGGACLLRGWWRWLRDADWHREDKEVARKAGDTRYLAEKANHRERVKFRLIASTITVAPTTGGVWVVVDVWPHWAAVAGFGVVGVLDLIGRAERRRNTDTSIAQERPVGLLEGSSPKTIGKWVKDALTAEGVTVEISRHAWMDPARMEYRMEILSPHLIEPKDLRAIEMFCDFPADTVRMRAVSGSSQVREIAISYGDPLADTPYAPWVPTGSRSCLDPLDLGVSTGNKPFAPILAGTHTAVLATTRGGKTEGALRRIIDRLSGCRDAVLYGVDLSEGPELELWIPVLQKMALTKDELVDLLAEIYAEKSRRANLLRSIARGERPDVKRTTTWRPELGPYLFVVIDEFHNVARFNGKGAYKDEPNFLLPTEEGIRTFNKYGIHFILSTQNAGTGDWGSTQLWRNIGLKIIGPCDRQDSTMVFGAEARDAGWAPHQLKPAQGDLPNDAGKVFVSGLGFTEPDVSRTYRPEDSGKVEQWAAQRAADGLPTLDGYGCTTIDAQVVHPALAAVLAAMDHHRTDRLSRAAVIAHANQHGGSWTDTEMLRQLKALGLKTDTQRSPAEGNRTLNIYYRDDIEQAARNVR